MKFIDISNSTRYKYFIKITNVYIVMWRNIAT